MQVAEEIQALKQEVEVLKERLGLPRFLGKGRMAPLDEVISRLPDSSEIPAPTPQQRFHDRSTVLVCPTRGAIDTRVLEGWNHLIHAMNQRRIGPLFARGYEVGEAYNALISGVLAHPQLSTWRYVLTIEDDNLLPPDAHMKLLAAMEAHPEYDAISALYCTKDPAQVPMAYGDPEQFRATGKTLHFPISRDLLDPDSPDPVEVLGIPMGCTLWRMDLFRRCPPSWFMTLSEKIMVDGTLADGTRAPFLIASEDMTDEQSANAKKCMTQDMAFCEVAVRYHGARFAVLPSLRVGHLDTATGWVY